MRTFSLIWSGIGCFATVAITVLSGVILANGNNLRAQEGSFDYLFVVLVYHPYTVDGSYVYLHEQVSGFSLGYSSQWYMNVYYIHGSVPRLSDYDWLFNPRN
jgi:hypothetical protein